MPRQQPDHASMFLMIWLSMFATVIGIGGIGTYLVAQEIGSLSLAAPEIQSFEILVGFYGIAAASFVAALMMPKVVASKLNAKELAGKARLASAVRAKLFAPYMIRICLFEVIAIIGMLAMVLEMNVMAGAPLIALSIVALLTSIPSDRLLIRMALGRDDAVPQV